MPQPFQAPTPIANAVVPAPAPDPIIVQMLAQMQQIQQQLDARKN